MNCKWLWFLAIALILGFSSLAEARIPFRPRPPPRRPPRGNCNVPPRARHDCGYPGISRETCLRRGCCFSGRYKNAKWCFYRR